MLYSFLLNLISLGEKNNINDSNILFPDIQKPEHTGKTGRKNNRTAQ
jgi:hypothetical protein